MYANELELLEGAPEDFSIPRASGKDVDQYQSSEDEPTLLPSSDSTEKGFGKIMADLIADNPLKGIPFLRKSGKEENEK